MGLLYLPCWDKGIWNPVPTHAEGHQTSWVTHAKLPTGEEWRWIPTPNSSLLLGRQKVERGKWVQTRYCRGIFVGNESPAEQRVKSWNLWCENK